MQEKTLESNVKRTKKWNWWTWEIKKEVHT